MPNLEAITKLIQSKAKSSHPWIRQVSYDQPFFSYDLDKQSWEEVSRPSSSTTQVQSFRILSWNIDFMLPFPTERMQVALDHLHLLISDSLTPSIIFLNEMLVSDLQLVQTQSWIRDGYIVTDVDDKYWESGHYGTVTLVPKSLPVKRVFRVHYSATKMERDGLFVDVDAGDGKTLRVCNSHLESLVADPPLRPRQVETAAKWMLEAGVAGAVMGGDFNAIQDFDRMLHAENGLRDAYLEMGGREDLEKGYTWGQMAPVKQRDMFGCSRMDKLFYCGNVRVVGFERFGLGVKVEDEKVVRSLMEEEGIDGGWVTDHAGVMGAFEVLPAYPPGYEDAA